MHNFQLNAIHPFPLTLAFAYHRVSLAGGSPCLSGGKAKVKGGGQGQCIIQHAASIRMLGGMGGGVQANSRR